MRMVLFSAIAIYITSFYNRGFIIHFEWPVFLKTVILISLLYYLIVPFTRLILLPLNILTLGLVSVLVYFFLFYFVISYFSLIDIRSWVFNGYTISYFANVIISAISISTIINLLEKLL